MSKCRCQPLACLHFGTRGVSFQSIWFSCPGGKTYLNQRFLAFYHWNNIIIYRWDFTAGRNYILCNWSYVDVYFPSTCTYLNTSIPIVPLGRNDLSFVYLGCQTTITWRNDCLRNEVKIELVVVWRSWAQWQSTGSSSQRCPGSNSQWLLAFSLSSIYAS